MQGISGTSIYDLVIIGLCLLLVGRGLWLGLLRQVTGLLALYLAFFAAGNHHDRISPLLREISTNPKVIFLASYILLFLLTYVVVMLLGKALSYVIKLTITSWFDRLLGGLVGFAKAVILVVLIHMLLGAFLAPDNQMLRACVTCDSLNGAADFTRELIRSEELRKNLMQQKPAIALETVKGFLAPGDSGKKIPTGKQ